MRWVAAVAVAVVLVIGTPGGAGATPVDPPQPTQEVTPAPSHVSVRLMTYNVCAQRCRAIRVPLPQRIRGIVAQVRAADVDVLAVQEAGPRASRVNRRIVAAFKEAGYGRAEGHSGNYLFYREKTVSALTDAGEPLWGRTVLARHTRRSGHRPAPVQLFRHRATGARFVVAGHHLTALDEPGKDRSRANEFADVEQAVRRWRRTHPGVPVLKMGDFNSLIQRPTRRYDSDSHRQRVWERLRGEGFTDAVLVAAHTTNRRLNTINRRSSDRRRFGPARHLDHVFVPRGLTVTAWGLVSRDVAYSNQLSDHDPVWAEVELPLP